MAGDTEMNINPLRRKSRASSGTLQSLLSPITRPKEVNTPVIERLGGSKSRGLYQDQFLESLERIGISRTSPKFAPTMALLADMPDNLRSSDISNLKMHDVFLSRALDGELVIRDFPRFTDILNEVYTNVASLPDQGHVATYIPELALVDPDQFGVSVCTIDGQQWKSGDSNVHFCIQSISKTVTYLLALEEHGEQIVHSHVGREPSGVGFNERLLNKDNLPHNPFINSGAIMCASLVKAKEDLATRFDHVMNCWARLTGGRPTFANAIYLDERSTADRNYCLAYMMNEGRAFPEGTDLMATLDFYFMLCSIEVTAEMLAVVAGTLASGGVCPITGERVFRENHVRDCLSLMASCGLYDGSGEFFFDIGFPAKSGVAGGIMFAIPGILGVCTFAPRLEDHGNSYRGIVFCKELVLKLEYHQFSILDAHYGNATYEKILQNIGSELLCAVSRNDLPVIQAFVAAKPSSVHYSDYDRRTPLHIAASCGYLAVVKYLLAHGANVNYKDALRNTPLDDATHHGHQEIVDYLTAENTFIESYGTELAQPGPAALFAGIDVGATGVIQKEHFIQLLENKGIIREAVNWGGLYAMLDKMENHMRLEHFLKLSEQYPIARQVVTSNLAVPDWEPYAESLGRIYRAVDSDDPPIRATSFSHMATDSHDAELWEASFCSTSGQVCRMSENARTPWRAMALSHIVNYLIAQELLGEEAVHAYVGKEPSGRNFNEFSLNADGKPHNPVIVSGALAVISLIKPTESKEKRFKYILSQWRKLTLGAKIEFDEETYQQEVNAVSRKWTLAYLLLECGAFPNTVGEEAALQTTVELYFMTLSILVDTTKMSRFASILANGGVDPFTQQRLFKKKVVRNVLSIMYACGMYDYSGEFTFRVGIPAQSSGGGAILGIIPELGGFCSFSPKLDQASNSVLGVRFCCQLTKEYSFHAYETLVRYKKDPSVFGGNWNDVRICNMFEAASKGDLVEVMKELDCLDINCVDYDGRTVLHVAASKNRKKVVYYLVENGANITLKDRWGNIPYQCTRSKKLKELLCPPGMESDGEISPSPSPNPTPTRGPEGEEPPNVAKSLLSKHMGRGRKGSVDMQLF